ncbi:MAG: hypothetical protein LBR58_04690 [Propionibacteriaceae bacterium]|jgi:tetratricopeptide (TPR) repeat protein|nr:hypothetical protein [Propionibacteriaceae bacterium]
MSKQDSRREIEELIEAARRMPDGPAAIAKARRAVEIAQELEDERLEYRARMFLTNEAEMGGESELSLSSFSWCLSKHDSDPERFPIKVEHHSLLWYYKWMPNTLASSPVFSRQQITTMLDDMEARYQRAGAGMGGVLAARYRVAGNLGDWDLAQELYEQVLATERDQYSDCEACTKALFIFMFLALGDEPRALALLDETMQGRYWCANQPSGMLAETLLAKLRAGRLGEAKADHTRSYRDIRSNPARAGTLACNLAFCAVTGNAARGLALLERHLGWLGYDPLDVEGQRSLLTDAAVVLEAVVADGHGGELVRGADKAEFTQFFGEHDGPWRAADLLPVVWAAAEQRARAFDERNGNDYVSSCVAQRKELLNERYDVPVHTNAFLDAPPPTPEPETVRELLNRARDLITAGQSEDAEAMVEKALSLGDADERAEACGLKINWVLPDEEAAQAWLARRITYLREAGREALADFTARHGLLLWRDRTAEGAAALRAELDTTSDGQVRAMAKLYIAQAMLREAEPDQEQARALLHEAVAEARDLTKAQILWLLGTESGSAPEEVAHALTQLLEFEISDTWRADVLRLLAGNHFNAGRMNQALELADQSCEVFARTRLFPQFHAMAASIAGYALLELGRPAEAVVRFQYGLREAARMEGYPSQLRFGHARALLNAGHAAEATEEFLHLLDYEESHDAPPHVRADTLNWVANAHYANELYSAALRCREQSAALFAEAGSPEQAALMHNKAGDLLLEFRMWEDALEQAQAALALVGDDPESQMAVAALENRATAKSGLGDDTCFADIDAAASRFRGEGGEPHTMELRARCLARLKRTEEASGAFLAAADGYVQAGNQAWAAQLEWHAGQLLAELDRKADAEPILRTALDRAEQAGAHPNLVRALALSLGDVLEALGRTGEASAARARVPQ